MRMVVIIVPALMIVGLAALGLVLTQKGATPTAKATSTVHLASATLEMSALPARAPVSQIAPAMGPEASLPILQADAEAQSGSPISAVTQAPSAAEAPNVKGQSPSAISKAMVYEATRLKDDATRWAHKLHELVQDLKWQIDLKENQDAAETTKPVEVKKRIPSAQRNRPRSRI